MWSLVARTTISSSPWPMARIRSWVSTMCSSSPRSRRRDRTSMSSTHVHEKETASRQARSRDGQSRSTGQSEARMGSMRFTSRAPLSGDVMQSINPWSWFIHSMGQLGLININLGRTPAPEIEERILDEVGSYGRQIGRISDALEVLLDRLELKDLDESQREAI